MEKSRREFLAGMGCTLLTRAAVFAGVERMCAINALAGPAAQAGSYQALVCVFMFGGNDANNVVIPIDGYYDAGGYYDTRVPNGQEGQGISIPHDQLLDISPPSAGATFGLHPALGNRYPDADTGLSLYDLWGQGKVAIVTNAGPLKQPVDRPTYRSDPRVRPYQLFSHSDQQTEWQTSYANSPLPTGWGGRTADVFGIDPSGFPTIASVAGVQVFSAGRSTRPIILPDAGTPLNQTLRLKRDSDSQDGSALLNLLNSDSGTDSPTLVRDVANISLQAINNSNLLSTDPTVTSNFPNTGLGRQLKQVTKLIKLAQTIGLTRQVFFCSIGGFDTHNDQNKGGYSDYTRGQPGLLSQVSQAIAAFYNALHSEPDIPPQVASQVTIFTESDFSRTFKPGGNDFGTGTDHAWGSHQFVVGDSVNGGDFYGKYPTLALSGDDDTDDGGGARGRWIPTTAVDQYAATLGLWFGVSDSDLRTSVFPNLGRFNFDPSVGGLGFMNIGGASAAQARRAVRRA